MLIESRYSKACLIAIVAFVLYVTVTEILTDNMCLISNFRLGQGQAKMPMASTFYFMAIVTFAISGAFYEISAKAVKLTKFDLEKMKV